MAYGAQVIKNDGSVLTTFDSPGSMVFVGKYTYSGGSGTTYTITNIPAGYLRIYTVSASIFIASVSSDGSGHATIVITKSWYFARNPGLSTTITILAFTSAVLGTYGLENDNSSGNLLFSSEYPTPEYVGELVFTNTTPDAVYGLAESSGGFNYQQNIYSAGSWLSIAGSGYRDLLLLWELPNVTNQWIYGPPCMAGFTIGSYFSVTCDIIKLAATSVVLPTCHIFVLGSVYPSSETYGLRTYDSSGNLTYDAGNMHIKMIGLETEWDYPNELATRAETSRSCSYVADNTAYIIPPFYIENQVAAGNGYYVFITCARRYGSTIYTKIFYAGYGTDTDIVSDSLFYSSPVQFYNIPVASTIY
jgi:hypothetical protein